MDDLSSFVIALTSWPAGGEAESAAAQLVEEGLVACVQISAPVRSVYRWKGQVERADEHQLVLKTAAPRLEALERRLRELHPYDVPEFVVLPVVAGSEAYLAWMREAVSDRS